MKKYLIIALSIFTVISTVLVANAEEATPSESNNTEQIVNDSIESNTAVTKAAPAQVPPSTKGAPVEKAKSSSISIIEMVLAGLNLLLTCLIVWVYIDLGRLKKEVAAYMDNNEKNWNHRINQAENNLEEKIKASIHEYDAKKVAELEEAERKRKIAAAEAARNAQSAREAIAAKTFVGKTLYGEYNPADNGFEHEWLTNAPKDSSQVRIDTTAETSADFTVMPGLVYSQVNIVVGACEIVAGNISDYNSYAVKEPGLLTLDERTQVWKIEKPVKIELIK